MTGFTVTPISADLVRVELFNDEEEPKFIALIFSADEAMDFSRKVANAALQVAPNKRK